MKSLDSNPIFELTMYFKIRINLNCAIKLALNFLKVAIFLFFNQIFLLTFGCHGNAS